MISAAQMRQVLHVEASDAMEGTSSFVMIVEIKAPGRWSRASILVFGSPAGSGGAAILSLSQRIQHRPEEDDACVNLLGLGGTKYEVKCPLLFSFMLWEYFQLKSLLLLSDFTPIVTYLRNCGLRSSQAVFHFC